MKQIIYMMNSISCIEIVKKIVKKQKLKYNSFTKDGIDFKNKLTDREYNELDAALKQRGMSLFITKDEIMAIKIHDYIYDMFGIGKEKPKEGYTKYLGNKMKCGYENMEKSYSKCMHFSIHKLIINVKVEIAIELIKKGELRLNEIAIYLHYYDYSHFSRQLSKETGHCPGFFKKRKQK